ncbi:MAG: hypothetical protein ACI4U2_00960 [Christensenellaceae bacterium]
MKEYLLSIAGVTVLSAVFTMILPSGKLHSFLAGILRLCCLFVLLSPVFSFVSSLPDAPSSTVIALDEGYLAYCDRLVSSAFEKAIEADLARFDPSGTYEVTAEVSSTSLTKIRFSLRISGEKPHTDKIGQVIAYLKETYRVEVVYESD